MFLLYNTIEECYMEYEYEKDDTYQLQHNYKTCATVDSNTNEYVNIQFHF